MKTKFVLCACVQNSGRSQIAEAFARYSSTGVTEFESTGTITAYKVNPIIVEVMKEKGIDISKRRTKLLTQNMIECADMVITMACSIEEVCQTFQIRYDDWEVDDPAGRTIDEIRDIRDQIEEKVGHLVVGV